MMDRPLVSVIIPCYNAERYVEQSIRSIMQQTYTALEIIAIDDGSVDGTVLILQRLAAEDQRIRLVIHDENKRLVFTLNEGLALARGRYIARMDADDIAMPNRIAVQVDVLECNSQIVVVGSFMRVIQAEQLRGKWIAPIDDLRIRSYLFIASPFFHPTIMFRNGLPDLYYREDAYRAEDYDFWVRLLEHGKGYNIPRVLLHYRLLATSETKLGEQDAARRFIIFSDIHTRILSGYGISLPHHWQRLYTASTVKDWIPFITSSPISELLRVYEYIEQEIKKVNPPVAGIIKGYLGLRLLAYLRYGRFTKRFEGYFEVLKSSYFYRGAITLILRRVKL